MILSYNRFAPPASRILSATEQITAWRKISPIFTIYVVTSFSCDGNLKTVTGPKVQSKSIMATLLSSNSKGVSAVNQPLLEDPEPKPRNSDPVDPNRIPSVRGLPHSQTLAPPSQQSSKSIKGQPQQIATLSPPIGQFVINTLLQIAAFAAAIAFGVYAVKSVTVGSDANNYAAKAVEQAVTANQLAILAVCVSGGNVVSDVKPHLRSTARFN